MPFQHSTDYMGSAQQEAACIKHSFKGAVCLKILSMCILCPLGKRQLRHSCFHEAEETSRIATKAMLGFGFVLFWGFLGGWFQLCYFSFEKK